MILGDTQYFKAAAYMQISEISYANLTMHQIARSKYFTIISIKLTMKSKLTAVNKFQAKSMINKLASST